MNPINTNVIPGHDRCVVTACDQNYFEGLILMYESVQSIAPILVVAFDLGMTKSQLALAHSKPLLKVLPLPQDDRIENIKNATQFDSPLGKKGKRIWPLWICPFLIEHAPCDDVYWLDCDLLVLRNIEEMFDELENGPVFTPENKAPGLTANNPKLYQHATIEGRYNPDFPVINAGVSGWRKSRDEYVLKAYSHLVERASMDSVIRGLISWHDQGCLIWAIQKTGKEDRVLNHFNWNLCVDNTPLKTKTVPYDGEFIDAVRELVQNASIVHWNGCLVPWTSS